MRSTTLSKRVLLVFMALLGLGAVEFHEPTYTRLSTNPLKERGLSKSYGLRLIGAVDQSLYYLHVPQEQVWNEENAGFNPLFYISKIDTNLNTQIRREVPLYHKRYLTTFESAILFDGKLWVFSSFTNRKAKKHYLLGREISLQTLNPAAEMRVMGVLDFSDWKNRPATMFMCQLSENNDRLMINFAFIDQNQSVLKRTLYVYHEGMTQDWYTEHATLGENPSEVLRINGSVVSDEGSIYQYGRLFPSWKVSWYRALINRRVGNIRETLHPPWPDFKYFIQHYSLDDRKGTIYTFALPEHFVRNMRIKPLDNGEILCYGICSDKGMISASGGFVCRFNPHTGRVSDLIIAPIDSRLKSDCFSEAEMKEYKKHIGNQDEWDPFEYTLSELKTRTDGTHFFIADQTLNGRRVESGRDAIFYSDIYYGNSLFVFSMDTTKGDMKAERIDKMQNMYPTNWLGGYIVTEYNGDLWFLFNQLPRVLGYHKKRHIGEIRLVQLSPDGTRKTKVLEKDVTFHTLCVLPETMHKVSPGAMIYGTLSFSHRKIGFEKLTIH
jgi:hypothetical protein